MENFSDKITALITLLGINLMLLVPLVGFLAVIYAWKKPAFAVLKRNFLAYFTNPTGYVFLCLFVALTSFAAFWPEEFFNANLTNLEQLNRVLPSIMLVFIPAITMSIWAEERRQGTDELLLTIPAADFDIVLGKYLAAAAIFTVSLLFSQVCNFLVLINLGSPDIGLFLGNYFGYWMVGLAMLAVGMTASFLTSNLTVGFVLGVVFCVPLVLASYVEVFFPDSLKAVGHAIGNFSIPRKFQEFETGVITFGAVAYFVMIIVTMLYLCMVLIGRRHWSGGKDGNAMGGHYFVRVLAPVIIAGAVSAFAAHKYLFRKDVTTERLGSLSDSSGALIEQVSDQAGQYLITIEAFISKDLPQQFVQKRFDLLTTLREIDAIGGDKISLRIYDPIDLYSEQANRAETLYGIKRETVETTVRGANTTQNVIFGVAFKSGQERSVIPFMGESLPIEYELMRSLATVTQQDRKKIGVLATDASLMGGGSFSSPDATERPLIAELRKQYEIVPVRADSPIIEDFDVLLAVQPSSLTPPQMKNFLDVVRSGKPTAVFEDPFPLLLPAPGTSQPKQGGGGSNPFMQQPPQPKGDIGELWDLLGVKLISGRGAPSRSNPRGGAEALVIWQDYNPHPEDAEVQNEFVWITPDNRAHNPFDETSPISAGLQKMLFLYPGGIQDEAGGDQNRTFTALVTTGPQSGTVPFSSCLQSTPFGQQFLRSRDEMEEDETATSNEYILAAHVKIEGQQAEGAEEDAEGNTDKPNDTDKPKDISVVLVTDIDTLSGFFFELRAHSEIFGERFARWELDNVPFVLNVLDVLADDDRFTDIRKRRRVHRELAAIQRLTEKAKRARSDARKEAKQQFKDLLDSERKQLDKKLDELRDNETMSNREKQEQLGILQRSITDRISATKERLDRDEEETYRDIDNKMAAKIHQVQDHYKLLAVMLPPIPPLFIAIWVFFIRRSRERESVAASRLV